MTAVLALTLLLAAPNLVANGDFETLQDGWPVGWSRGWARDGAGAFRCELTTDAHGGANALHFVHTGARDWSLQPPGVTVREGDVLELSCWVKQPGPGQVVLAATLAPAQGEEGIQWSAGSLSAAGPSPWRQLRTRVVVSPGLVRATPRIIGTGPADVIVDDFETRLLANLVELRAAYTGARSAILESAFLKLEMDPGTLGGSVTDKRTGRSWAFAGAAELVPRDARAVGGGVSLTAGDPARDATLEVTVMPGG